MERIDLFDKYIHDQLSDEQRSEFDTRLKSDEDFASDFKVYLLTVDGICKEARQDNLDFGMAMKRLSKEQLIEIVGKSEIGKPTDAILETKPKIIKFRPCIWQIASIAAVLIIAFTVVFNVEKNARYSVDNAIFACAEINIDQTRDGSEVLDIQSMTENELNNNLPILVKNFNAAETLEEEADNGFALAMAYLRLHDREEAKAVLNTLVFTFKNNPEYADDVRKWQSILNVLK